METTTTNSLLFSKEDKPFGLTYAEWTVKWWQWWCSTPVDPPTAQENETGQVAFLTTKGMERYDKNVLETKNTISQDKAILFPVDKWISVGFPFSEDKILIDTAKKRIDMIPNISIRLDGHVLQPVRVQSSVFKLHIKRDLPNPEVPEPYGKRIAKIVKGKYKAASEGYWIFLKPKTLQKGMHEIPSFASCKTQVLYLSVHHDINIV